MTRKVLTLKSGRFVFSRRLSDGRLLRLLTEAKVLYATVIDLPILPSLASVLEEELVRRSIFGTAALEGNPLTEDEVGDIIFKPDSIKTKRRAEKEIQNLGVVYDFVAGFQALDSVEEVTESTIKQIHKLVTRGIEHESNIPGKYRNKVVKVGDVEHGGVYTPPKCLPDIKMLMKEYISWINSKEILQLGPTKRAALAHYHLGLIHPFGDGNGRTARLVEALLLRLAGIKYVPVMLSNFYYKNIDDYFWAFSNARKNKKHDVTPFVEFVFRGVVDSLNEIKQRVIHFIRKFTLRDHYDSLRGKKVITQRQHDFMILLLDDFSGSFTLGDIFKVSPFKILYRKVSERTARRDLKKLHSEGLLSITDEGKYVCNLRALDHI